MVEITTTIYSNSKRSVQFLKTNDFLTRSGDFSDLINRNNLNSNWKKSLGFRNLQEKLEKDFCKGFQSRTIQYGTKLGLAHTDILLIHY